MQSFSISRTPFQRIGGLVFVLALASLPLFASTGGSVAGLVLDSTDAVIPGVTVVVCNAATAVEQKTITNAAGFCAFPSLPSGRYELRIDHDGFKPYRQPGVEITATALRIDVRLNLGAHSETMTVTESPAHPSPICRASTIKTSHRIARTTCSRFKES